MRQRQAEERPSFLKKRSKKLLHVLASAFSDGLSSDERKLSLSLRSLLQPR
jgi:hypothetical protein